MDGKTNVYFLTKDYNKLESKFPIEININTLFDLFQQPIITDIQTEYFNRLNIFRLKSSKSSHGKDICIAERHYSIPGSMNQNELLNVAVDKWPPTKIFWLPSKNLFEKQFRCQTLHCGYVTKLKSDLEMHMIKCTNVQTITPKQIAYGTTHGVITQLERKFNFQFSKLRQTEFMVFDIETFTMNGILVPISIACAGTFTKPMYFERESDHPESGFKLVATFLDYLLKMQKIFVKKLPSQITQTIRKLEIEKDDESKTTSAYSINKMLQYLSKYQTLKIFGFNSRNSMTRVICVICVITRNNLEIYQSEKSKFDIPVLMPSLIRYNETNHLNMKPLKKGTNYFCLNIAEPEGPDLLQFRDVLSFTTPCTLDRFCKQWKTDLKKGCFPHG